MHPLRLNGSPSMLRKFLNVVALATIAVTGSISSASEYIPPEREPRGDAAAAQSQVVVCSACHGAEGQATLDQYPNLGGQHYTYLLRQLKHFQSGERMAALMMGQLDGKSEQDLKNLAAFYAGKPKATEVAPTDANLAHGERIWRAGIAEKGVPACAACHGPAGVGNGPANFPVLSGQNAGYTASQLRNYRAGERNTGGIYSQMMMGVASGMSDDDIDAVAAFAQGLD